MSLSFVHTRTRQCLNKANCNQDGETSGGTPAPTILVSLSIAKSRTEASNINICSLHHANKIWKTIANLPANAQKKNVRLKLQEDRGSASILSLKGCPSKQNTKTRRFVSHNSAYAQKPRYNCKITQDALARKCTETKCKNQKHIILWRLEIQWQLLSWHMIWIDLEGTPTIDPAEMLFTAWASDVTVAMAHLAALALYLQILNNMSFLI